MTCFINYLHHVITFKHFAASLDLNLPFHVNVIEESSP